MEQNVASQTFGVRVWEETVDIPTYGVGEPNKNPMFLEKRVYQGSSGRVYPHPVIDRIENEKEMKPHRIINLENEYLLIQIMPDIGGRIYRALDKTNQHDFVYYNRVIKPALVGLAGPWISGGIEFNWPQHHRPNTFGPVEYQVAENTDGSKTVWVSEIDRMYGTKGMAGYTLYPGKAYLEVKGQLFNRTSLPQSFLWWANPAFAANKETQSIFPPDVTAVFDHAKRDVSTFPIATGVYYKVDYSQGVDISRYRNIPVPTSFMADKSDYDFLGGYDYGKQAGILLIANHHISPGKKQWTWGFGDFGQAWDRNLTDEDGPYVELMVGVYTDNQPDFSWLQPNEEKTFKQYFLPYKAIGAVKNATIDAAVNLELLDELSSIGEIQSKAKIQVYATACFADAVIELRVDDKILYSQTNTLSPTDVFVAEVGVPIDVKTCQMELAVRAADGRNLVSCHSSKFLETEIPEAAEPILPPQELKNTEALYLAALHLEQYRHATFQPEDYYLEGLKRDPDDIRLNNAYGSLLFRRGRFHESELCCRRAIATLTRYNPNPVDGEAFYNLGRVLKIQGKLDEAYSAFYKSIWSAAFQDTGFLSLARIECERGNYESALKLAESAMEHNYRSPLSRNLKTAILVRLGRYKDAEVSARQMIEIDPADFMSRHQLLLIYHSVKDNEKASSAEKKYHTLLRNDVHNALALVQEYAEAGCYREAIDVLQGFKQTVNSNFPMLHYSLGYLYLRMGDQEKAKQCFNQGMKGNSDYCFPNTLWDYLVLSKVIVIHPHDASALYYIGNWLYDKSRANDAISFWEASAKLNPEFAIVHRNLALAYMNKQKNSEKAVAKMELAFKLAPGDARILYELDQLFKKLNRPLKDRLSLLDECMSLVEQRDDLYIEYVTLLNSLGMCDKVLLLLGSRQFHPWEGGEGKAVGQYSLAKLEIGKKYLRQGLNDEAVCMFKEALVFPENLGEGKLYGAQDNSVYFYLGSAFMNLNLYENADAAFDKATQGIEEPVGAMYYNDQPPDSIFYQGLALMKLNRVEEAYSRFERLVSYGEQHLADDVKIDYFAVSLPNFLVFDDDLNMRNQIHCRYMAGLGWLGLGQILKANEELTKVIELDVNHQGAMTALHSLREMSQEK
jgi:tetratricopeptide (TPR) repeat protein